MRPSFSLLPSPLITLWSEQLSARIPGGDSGEQVEEEAVGGGV